MRYKFLTGLLLFSINIASFTFAQENTAPLKISPATTTPTGTNTPSIALGTGTVLGYFNGLIATSTGKQKIPLDQILQTNQIPTRLFKTWLNDGIISTGIASWMTQLVNKKISPVLIEHLPVKGWYLQEYGVISGIDIWDSAVYKWNDDIAQMATAYLNTTVVNTALAIASVGNSIQDPNTFIYYVLSPEMSYVGDAATCSGYDAIVQQQIAILRNLGGPKIRIVRGYFQGNAQFENNLGRVIKFINNHPQQMSTVDYFGPTFHDLDSPDATVASRIYAQLYNIRKSTNLPFLIPQSYIRWVPGTDSDVQAGEFWDWFRNNRTNLIAVGLAGWCLSATLEERSDGTGLVTPTVVPNTGYPVPLPFSIGGAAFVNWMNTEAQFN